MGPIPVRALVALQAPPPVPDPGSFAGYDDLGIAAILIFVIFLILGNVALMLWAFYRRIVVWGETAEKLIANESRRADLAEEDADGWKNDTRRMFEDSNANLARALEVRDELSWRRREGP